MGKAAITGLKVGTAAAIVTAISAAARGKRGGEWVKAVAIGFAKGFISGTIVGALTQLGVPRAAARPIAGTVTGTIFGEPFTGLIGGSASAALGGSNPFFAGALGTMVGEISAPTSAEGAGSSQRCK